MTVGKNIEQLRALLASSPRDEEYFDLGETGSWSPDEVEAVAAELAGAARAGDRRAVTALDLLRPSLDLRPFFEELLDARDPGVRLAAAVALSRRAKERQRASLYGVLRDGAADDVTLLKVARHLLETGDRAALLQLLGETTEPAARVAVLTVLWQAEGFNQVPQLWWRGLGLLWMRLTIPVQSFRTGADDAFRALLVEPRGLALTEDPDALPPVDLQRWVLDALDGRGPIDADGLRAIPLPLREALQVNLARFALSQRSPRCLEYVWLLDGAAHRDLFELAARSPHVRFAQAASELLARLDALR